MTCPHERTTFAGLVPACELGSVVRDRPSEVRPPGLLSVVAVRARIGQDVNARVTYLDGQRVCVCMRGDAEVPVRAAVAPAPDLVLPTRAQQRHSRVSEP